MAVRKRNLYKPGESEPFTISRSKIDLFLQCPRCFYLDRRLGVGRPSIPGFALNSAVDQLLKNEFDVLRAAKKPHLLMQKYKIDAIPFDHPDLGVWRDDVHKWKGASFIHEPTNLEVSGIVDDIWVNPKEELHMVDYKSTSTSKKISLEDEYKVGYKRQVEVYQWIFRRNGFNVSDKAYFVYANAHKDRDKFDGKLEFGMQIIEHIGNDSWVEQAVYDVKKCLDGEELPEPAQNCEYCEYRGDARKVGDKFP